MKREMKHSGVAWIGEIPKHWEVVRNKNAFSNSKTIVGENWNNTQLLSLTTKGIKAIDIGSTSGKVTDSYETYQVVGKDNLVMCLFDLDCSAVFSGLSQIEGMISPAYKVLTVQNGFLPAFYDKWFNYIFDGRKFMFLSKNIRYSLVYDEFASLQIVKPPIEEQQKIAEFLDRKCGEIDVMISLQEKVIEELKAYKQSIITETVTKGLNPNTPMKDSGIEWIGEIPEHWDICQLKRYSKVNNGKEVVKEVDDIFAIPVYGSGGIFKYTDTELCQGEVVMFGRKGTLGKPIYANTKLWVVDTMYFLTFNKTYLFPRYAYYQLATFDWQPHITQTALPSIVASDIVACSFPFPSLTEQQQIADYLDRKCAEIDELVAVKQQKIETLKEYKKSLIYEYVTGKKEIECFSI